MQVIELQGQTRESIGKHETKLIRINGNIPCVLYGGKENIHFTIQKIPFNKVIITPNVYVIKLTIDGKEVNAIVKDLQFHPVSDDVLHVDFQQIFEDKPFSIKLPIKIVGVSDGVKQGGKLQIKMRKLKVNGLLKNMPNVIEIDISHLNIGNSVKIDSLKVANLTFEEPKNAVVCSVNLTRSAARALQAEPAKK
jgi:large subunit ribosomal protein L25